jgi:hypothetical protein
MAPQAMRARPPGRALIVSSRGAERHHVVVGGRGCERHGLPPHTPPTPPHRRPFTGPCERPVQMAMKATASSAAGRSHAGALKDASCFAKFSAFASLASASATSSRLSSAVALMPAHFGPHSRQPRTLSASACALAFSAFASASAVSARATALRCAARSAYYGA